MIPAEKRLALFDCLLRGDQRKNPDIAAEFGVSAGTVYKFRQYISGPVRRKKRVKPDPAATASSGRGHVEPVSALTPEQIEQNRQAFLNRGRLVGRTSPGGRS